MGETNRGGAEIGASASTPDHDTAQEAASMAAAHSTTRTSLSVRTRFEIFKRDSFQCRYCGRCAPDVMLQVDHVVPVARGGTDEPLNLVTACAECNSGKAAVPLSESIQPVDASLMAYELAQQEHAIREYNETMLKRQERIAEARTIAYEHFLALTEWSCMRPPDFNWLMSVMEDTPLAVVLAKMDAAARSRAPKRAWIPYLRVCIQRWHETGA